MFSVFYNIEAKKMGNFAITLFSVFPASWAFLLRYLDCHSIVPFNLLFHNDRLIRHSILDSLLYFLQDCSEKREEKWKSIHNVIRLRIIKPNRCHNVLKVIYTASPKKESSSLHSTALLDIQSENTPICLENGKNDDFIEHLNQGVIVSGTHTS